MGSVRFLDQVADLEIDSDGFNWEIANKTPADRCYVVLFTPRSGSSWLTSILSAAKVLGQPEEYVNESFVRNTAKATNSRDPKGMLAILKRRRKTPNGVFGIEATSTQIKLFGEAEFFESFGAKVVMFHLWRDNIVAQGISLYRAVTTKRFHSHSPYTEPPPYDAVEICKWIGHLFRIENENRSMLDRNGYFPRVIRYEDITRSRNTTIAIFADALRVDVPSNSSEGETVAEFKKIGDQWNRTAEQAFRNDEKGFVQDVEAQRLIRR
jgi:trehalose 2-sulfotransferase